MNDENACGSCGPEKNAGAPRRPERGELDGFLERLALKERMEQIRHKVLVLSGKGGVGKSTVAANLAVALAKAGKKVGLLDVDIHGPSIPKLLHLEGQRLKAEGDALLPIPVGDNLKVISMGFLLDDDDQAVIWRGPMKMGVIKQFLRDVVWGALDYLVIDSPPGTGDEPLSVCQLIEDAAGAVVVTTPQEVALADVRRSIRFCRELKLPVLGIIENMSGLVCPKCGETTYVFKSGGGERLAREMAVPFLGRIPLDPQIAEACDQGTPYLQAFSESASARAFAEALEKLVQIVEAPKPAGTAAVGQGPKVMAETKSNSERKENQS